MKRAIKAEERKLFRAAMQGVKRKRAIAVDPEPETPPEAPKAVTETLPPPKRKIPPIAPPLPRTLNEETARRLKTKATRPQAKLDLHGMTEAVAHAALIAFIQRALAKNHHLVLVITGKGKAGQGTLRRNLPLWLEAPALRPYILASAPAFAIDGGDGAFYIHLRRRTD